MSQSQRTIVVDVANVMGARADGWWRDRAGAALRLAEQITALAARDPAIATAWVLVLEGKGRDAELDADSPVTVVRAARSGDDTIVAVAAGLVAAGEDCLVVTADRELRRRCEQARASVTGPGWLLAQLLIS